MRQMLLLLLLPHSHAHEQLQTAAVGACTRSTINTSTRSKPSSCWQATRTTQQHIVPANNHSNPFALSNRSCSALLHTLSYTNQTIAAAVQHLSNCHCLSQPHSHTAALSLASCC
jgi:hypothetical protein